ncbi:MAG: hypothetical protein GF364_15155 [Candidatus Lokiarchaeota archaeon]|nr:hypothetical protein [Candidatus Lokiarchaeota archaeon]
MGKIKIKKRIKEIIVDNRAGSIIEYSLIIGFSLIAFVVIISIITSILDWSNSALSDFFNFLDF